MEVALGGEAKRDEGEKYLHFQRGSPQKINGFDSEKRRRPSPPSLAAPLSSSSSSSQTDVRRMRVPQCLTRAREKDEAAAP